MSPTASWLAGTSSSDLSAFDAPRLGGRELDERFDRVARAFGGVRFDEFTQQHEERNHARSLVIAGRKRREDRDGHEFVDAQAAQLQVLDCRHHDGIAEDKRPDHRTGAGHDVRGFKHPVHHECVDDEHEPEQHPRQPHVAMGVIVAATFRRADAIMFVLAEERGDLHGVTG